MCLPRLPLNESTCSSANECTIPQAADPSHGTTKRHRNDGALSVQQHAISTTASLRNPCRQIRGGLEAALLGRDLIRVKM